MKNFTLLTLVASTLAAAAPAAAETYKFERNGIEFVADETRRADGVRLIEGSDSNGATFSFVVRGNQVSGTYRGQPVFFTTPETKTDKVAAR